MLDQGLRVFDLEIYYPRELAFVVRIVRIEAFRDKFSVVVVLSENNRLPEAIPARNLRARGHQMLQHLVNGILVKKPFVDRVGIDPVRRVARTSVYFSSSPAWSWA